MIKDFNKIAIIAGEQNISYTELLKRINLCAAQTPKGKQTKTIIFGENRVGWIYAFFGVWRNAGMAVPVDASSTVEDLEYIIRDCTPDCLWTSEACRPVAQQAIEQSGVAVTLRIIEDFEQAPCDACDTSQHTPEDEDTALIIYTSGTTGSPKGVMLSYRNLYANFDGVTKDVPIFDGERRTLVLLPVHHVLPLLGTIILPIISGGGLAICPSLAGPDIMDTLCRGKIAIFVGVPRLWQTLYTGIKKKIDASAVTRGLFALCEKVGSRSLSRFVFQSVRKKMGGHIDYCVSGGAALDVEIGRGLRTLGLDVLEGYGMTEAAPMISFTRPGDIIPGSAGLALSCVDIKIIDGEICAKGPNIMQGYYNRPEETAAVIDKDGYLHTGDLARLDEQGHVYITGRTKEIIVLSNGKNVQPNEIEFKLEKFDAYVKEAAVTQDGDLLKAIIVPQPAWAEGMSDEDLEQDLKRLVLEPYNRTVENYKKLMSLCVYRGDLPRTKLDKLKRYKLKDIIAQAAQQKNAVTVDEESLTPEFRILRTYIQGEKKLTVKPTDHLETDLAFDSLDRVGLQGFIEQTFGMEINADDMLQMKNVQELADHIASGKTRQEVEDIDWAKMLSRLDGTLRLPSSSPLMPVHFKMLKTFFRLNNRLSVKGIENIPAEGPFIVAPNHESYIDAPVAMAGFTLSQLRQSYFYATEDHVKPGLGRWMAQRNNVIIMERRDLKNSILKMGEALRQGKNLVIFPEGSRSHDGELQAFKKTFAILSRELNIPILPVCIRGAYEALPRGSRRVKMTPIEVEYLPLIRPAESDTYETLTDKTREAILNKL